MPSPGDLNKTPLNPDPRPEQLVIDDYVERPRRILCNDFENIPAFRAAGLLFVTVDPAPLLAFVAFYGFVVAPRLLFRACITAKPHEARATFYSVGSLLTRFTAADTLVTAIFRIGRAAPKSAHSLDYCTSDCRFREVLHRG